MITLLLEYFSPHQRIARKLRACQRLAAKHHFHAAYSTFGEQARTFENFSD